MKKTRILVVDDHQVVRRGVKAILSGRPDLEVCGAATTGVRRWRPSPNWT